MTHTNTDLLCFAEDWDLASDHHDLLARLAGDRRVFFIERPRFSVRISPAKRSSFRWKETVDIL